jgi:raffinose/stachyose/melibiose transport system permease protein
MAIGDATLRRTHVYLAPIALLWMVPVIMVVGLSLLPTENPGTTFFGIFPSHPSLTNYRAVWEGNPIFQHLINSLLITVPSVVLVLFFGSMAAFALTRLEVPLKGLVFGALILAMILPMASIVVSTFKILQSMGLYNSLTGLVLVYTALGLPFAVIILRTAFQAVPRETYEAAIIDGARPWQIYWRIYLPLGKPAAAVVVI